jgi:hypothetical protein
MTWRGLSNKSEKKKSYRLFPSLEHVIGMLAAVYIIPEIMWKNDVQKQQIVNFFNN